MYIDSWEADVVMLPQGDGQDHTLWDWRTIEDTGRAKVLFYETRTKGFSDDWRYHQEAIDKFWEGMTSSEVTNQYDCELHRQEEINLYYQCTQNAYNGYALDHFGGDMRSYPRWIFEYKRCNIMLHKAECCSIQRDGIDYECPPCTDITLPMPEPFGPVKVPNEPEPKPEPVICDAIPDLSMFSVYRPRYIAMGVDNLFESQFQFWCLDFKQTSKYEGTINIKMVGNAKVEPNYEVRLNQDDCTTIELKKYGESDYLPGGQLVPYGAPFTGLDAYYFKRWATDEPEKYDSKVGQCICDNDTGVCEGFYSEQVKATISA